MNAKQGRNSAQAILTTVQLFHTEENRQMVVNTMVRLLNENGQKELAFYITEEAYERNMLIGYKYVELMELLEKEAVAQYTNFAREHNFDEYGKALKNSSEQVGNCYADMKEVQEMERIEPIFRDAFLNCKGSMTECNLCDGFCTFTCEECPNGIEVVEVKVKE